MSKGLKHDPLDSNDAHSCHYEFRYEYSEQSTGLSDDGHDAPEVSMSPEKPEDSAAVNKHSLRFLLNPDTTTASTYRAANPDYQQLLESQPDSTQAHRLSPATWDKQSSETPLFNHTQEGGQKRTDDYAHDHLRDFVGKVVREKSVPERVHPYRRPKGVENSVDPGPPMPKEPPPPQPTPKYGNGGPYRYIFPRPPLNAIVHDRPCLCGSFMLVTDGHSTYLNCMGCNQNIVKLLFLSGTNY